jgi:hypothetical protein
MTRDQGCRAPLQTLSYPRAHGSEEERRRHLTALRDLEDRENGDLSGGEKTGSAGNTLESRGTRHWRFIYLIGSGSRAGDRTDATKHPGQSHCWIPAAGWSQDFRQGSNVSLSWRYGSWTLLSLFGEAHRNGANPPPCGRLHLGRKQMPGMSQEWKEAGNVNQLDESPSGGIKNTTLHEAGRTYRGRRTILAFTASIRTGNSLSISESTECVKEGRESRQVVNIELAIANCRS